MSSTVEFSASRVLSSATSRSHVRLKSSEALRNSAMLFPIDLASCGSLRGPKKIRATTRMNSNSVLPSESSISANNFFCLPLESINGNCPRLDCIAHYEKSEGNRAYRVEIIYGGDGNAAGLCRNG